MCHKNNYLNTILTIQTYHQLARGDLCLRVREIIVQVAEEMYIKIGIGVLSADHVNIFADISPHNYCSRICKDC